MLTLRTLDLKEEKVFRTYKDADVLSGI